MLRPSSYNSFAINVTFSKLLKKGGDKLKNVVKYYVHINFNQFIFNRKYIE